MNLKKPDKGLVASASAHAALLLVALVGFSSAQKFSDAQESLPVEMITDEQFSQLAKGEKTAKETKPATKAVKAADITEAKADAPVNPVTKEVPLPPPPLKRTVDPVEDAKEAPPVPPVKPVAAAPPPPPKPDAPVPPVRPPEPAKPAPPPPKAEVKPPPPPEKPDPEVVTPLPPVKPPPPKLVLAKLPDPPPPVPEKPKAAPAKPVLDQVSSLLKDTKPDPPEKKHPRPVTPAPSAKPFDPNAINNWLHTNASINKPSTAKEPSVTASLGAPTARAPRMPAFMANGFNELMKSHFDGCWTDSSRSFEGSYRPEIRVQFLRDGTLASVPVLTNPSAEPKARALGESALRAIRECGPMRVPEKFQAFYDDWKNPFTLQMTLASDN